jgi:hypothetical protein
MLLIASDTASDHVEKSKATRIAVARKLIISFSSNALHQKVR